MKVFKGVLFLDSRWMKLLLSDLSWWQVTKQASMTERNPTNNLESRHCLNSPGRWGIWAASVIVQVHPFVLYNRHKRLCSHLTNADTMSDFSFAVMRYHDQGNLYNKALNLGFYGSRGLGYMIIMGRSMAEGSGQRAETLWEGVWSLQHIYEFYLFYLGDQKHWKEEGSHNLLLICCLSDFSMGVLNEVILSALR